ncbi:MULTISPECIES: phosphotransferase [unclassified Agarivorans]|uniref:phosphotransferase n=1 Tax=unclassified Agarivorans TaxID=2636026 RepID=UPI0026E28D24|nr:MULTISPECIES: phosphotransferase [unclassified Agarivorans]MDO6684501.1 phosphotransferase [Agarivorans sp. 3_MG-2023]MDO6714666.1 phosphotransferase [Agarivorans sp. 2_MG-2023]
MIRGRLINLSTLSRIATGNTAEVFAFEDSKVLKVYFSGYPEDEAENEAAKALFAYQQGLTTPKVIDVLEVESRPALIFERCLGPSLDSYLLKHPNDIVPMGELFAGLHADIHRCQAQPLDTTAQRLALKIQRSNIAEPLKLKAINQLNLQALDSRLCHGDFHPANVLLSSNGPVTIDWVDATQGQPISDVARTVLLISTSQIAGSQVEQQAYQLKKQQFLAAYQQHYHQLCSTNNHQLSTWTPIVAAERLSEKLPDASATQTLEIAQQLV